ncbi:asparagine synthase-related protein [Nonomuraea sp. NPDC050663]|uniref:asparagine synthase-related protein n=1 Tax=Nonomuraea sp. NPDC050663 TaxID=3364370 RepID=UPI0037902E1D
MSSGPWFVCLPDHPGARAAAETFLARCPHVVHHRSGRPWLAGDWPEGWLRTRTRARTLFGPEPGNERTCHVLSNDDGRMRLRGTLSGGARLFHARLAGLTVVADRADVLAALVGAELDQERIAAHLFDLPIEPVPPWRGVHAVRPDHAVEIDPDGRARLVRVWSPPEPELPLEPGARAVAAALRESVDAHLGTGVRSADLSGGLGSTSLCFLAEGLTTVVTTVSDDPADNDLDWAERALRHLPPVEHLTVTPGQYGMPYDQAVRSGQRVDLPFRELRAFGMFRAQGEMLAAKGSQVHMTGFGADRLFVPPASYLARLARRRPLLALSHLRAMGPSRSLVRMMADTSAYGDWFRPGRWGTPVVFPAWVLRRLWRATLLTRQLDQAGADLGLRTVHPFCDGPLAEAVLRVRPEERGDPRRHRPLLVASMRGIVPDENLGRTSRGRAGIDARAGLRGNQAELLALCDDSILGELGLIDPDVLRSTLLGPIRHEALAQTLACEAWLRGRRSAVGLRKSA